MLSTVRLAEWNTNSCYKHSHAQYRTTLMFSTGWYKHSSAPHSWYKHAHAQYRTAGTRILMLITAQLVQTYSKVQIQAYCQYRTGGTALRHPTALEVAYAASARGEINGESPLLWCKVYCTRASSHLIWAPGAAAPQPPGRSRKPKGPALRK